jgi:uncharacterized lipoprotein YmbA
MNRLSLWTVACCCVMIGVLSGCRSLTPPVTYYTLSSIPVAAIESDGDGKVTVTIGIQPPELPGTINRTQMVKRAGAHQLVISSLHRWADFPDGLVQQVLGENLQVLIPEARVVNSPWPTGLKPDITVAFQFFELIGTTDNKMLLNAQWTIADSGQPPVVQVHRKEYVEPMPGSDFEGLAAAHSRVLEVLCRQVAQSLRTFVN